MNYIKYEISGENVDNDDHNCIESVKCVNECNLYAIPEKHSFVDKHSDD
jgi:hypothetical protein